MREHTKKHERSKPADPIEPEEFDEADKVADRERSKSPRMIFARIPSRLVIVLDAIAAVAFLIFSVIRLVGDRAMINERRKELNELKNEITVQEIKNDEMSKTYNLDEKERSDYMEQIARDELDYVREGERVFVNIKGD